MRKLTNVKDYLRLFSLLGQDTVKDTGISPVTYFYPRCDHTPLYADLAPDLYGVIRMVFRIAHAQVMTEEYPDGQGFVSLQKIPSYPITPVEIPKHRYWRTVIEEEKEDIMDSRRLRPILSMMEENGYTLHGDVLLYQIMNAHDPHTKKLVCVECDVG